MPEIGISGTKLTRNSEAPEWGFGGVKRKRGLGSAGPRKVHRGGEKKGPLSRPAVWCGAGIFHVALEQKLDQIGIWSQVTLV